MCVCVCVCVFLLLLSLLYNPVGVVLLSFCVWVRCIPCGHSKYPHREHQPEENPEDVEHTNPQTTHPQTVDNTTYYHGPQTTPTPKYLPKNSHPTSHCPLDIPLNKLTVTRNDDAISASPRNIDAYTVAQKERIFSK